MGRLARLAADAAAARFRPGPGPRPPRRIRRCGSGCPARRWRAPRRARDRRAARPRAGAGPRGPAQRRCACGAARARSGTRCRVRRLTDGTTGPRGRLDRAACRRLRRLHARGPRRRRDRPPRPRRAAPPRPSRCFWRSRRTSAGAGRATLGGGAREPFRRPRSLGRPRPIAGPLRRLSGLLRGAGAPAISARRRGRRIGA